MTYRYRTGDARVALRLAGVSGVSWSPDDRNLAALASHDGHGELAVEHADGSVSRRRVALAGRAFDAAAWISPSRLAVVEVRAGTGHLFTTGLRRAGTLADWDLPGEVTAGAVWTLDGERIRRLALDGSGARLIGRRIAGARVIGVIPEGARVDASGAGARSSTTRSISCPARAPSSPSATRTSPSAFTPEPAGSGLFPHGPAL